MRAKILLFTVLITLSGCTFHNPFISTTEQKIEKAKFAKCKMDAQINQQTRQYVTGIKEILESKAELNKEEQISLDLDKQAERLLGDEPIERIDVTVLSDLYDYDRDEYNRVIGEKEKTVTIIKKSELDNRTTIEALEEQLEAKKSRNTLWYRIKHAGIGFIILMVIGIILLLIFAPNALGWIISKIPSLIFCLGVSSARVVKALVKGVQKARSQIADLPDNQKLDKYQILKLIDTGLQEEADNETVNTVDVLRKKYHLASISQRLKSQVQANTEK